MRQFFSTLAVTVVAASVTLAGCGSNAQAQDGGGGGAQGGGNPALRQAMDKARTDAQTSTMGDLSAGHRAQVQKIIDGVNNGSDTDFAGDVQKIDSILSPDESKAVLGERDKMAATIKAAVAQSGGGAGGGRRGGGGMMKSNDPGRFVLYVNLSRERMRAIRQAMQQRNGGSQ